MMRNFWNLFASLSPFRGKAEFLEVKVYTYTFVCLGKFVHMDAKFFGAVNA